MLQENMFTKPQNAGAGWKATAQIGKRQSGFQMSISYSKDNKILSIFAIKKISIRVFQFLHQFVLKLQKEMKNHSKQYRDSAQRKFGSQSCCKYSIWHRGQQTKDVNESNSSSNGIKV